MELDPTVHSPARTAASTGGVGGLVARPGIRSTLSGMSLPALPPLVMAGAMSGAADGRTLIRRLGRGELVRLRRGVYVESSAWHALDPHREQPLLRVVAAMRTLRCCDYVLSHDSACLVHGLGVPNPTTAQVHVTRRKVHGDRDRSGVKHHLAPYDERQVVVVGGLRVLDLARTALDMAREHGLVAGVATCDAVLRRGVTRAQLAQARATMWCWPGSRTMDAALDLADAGAESWLESEGRVLVDSLGIGRPETQFGLTDGSRTAWCDLRVGRHVFEIDGRVKYRGTHSQDPERTLWAEKQRQDFVTGFKLGMSRITAHDCRDGRDAARRRLLREYRDTCERFGTDVADLAPYVLRPAR